MRRQIFAASIVGLCAGTAGHAATINFVALNDGNGNGVNAGVSTQPVGIAQTLNGNTTYSYFEEPDIPNGENRRSVFSTNSAGVEMNISEGTYDSASFGAATDLADIAFSGSNLDFEASNASTPGNGTSQGAAASYAWGVDTDSNITTAGNAVLSFDLFENIHGTFSAVLLDMEGGALNAAPAYAAVYDDQGLLDTFVELMFPGSAFGNNSEYLFTVQGLGLESTIAFFVGDNTTNGTGASDRLAAADFGTFAPVPVPASAALLCLGLAGFASFRRRS